jgi:hypothetical protein
MIDGVSSPVAHPTGQQAATGTGRGCWHRWGRRVVMLVVFLVVLRVAPPLWCGRDATSWWRGDRERQIALVQSVERWTSQPLTPEEFTSGNATFNGEWHFGTYQMAILGLAQVAREHPELKSRCLTAMDQCEARLLSEEVRQFDRRSWREDPLESLDGNAGHAGYLGYLNLALGVHRALDPAFARRAFHDRITAKLARALQASPISLLETYPGETYPVDNCAVAASLMLWDRVEGTHRYQPVLDRWRESLVWQYTDPRTGLLFQAVSSRNGGPVDVPRGSGTLLGAYFLGLAGDPLSTALYATGRRELWAPAAGFGAAREYPWNGIQGRGDIDSGPVILGRGISATGFLLGCARQQGDEATYAGIYRTVHLFGAPTTRGDRQSFVTGGPLGDALLLALLTAQPVGQTPSGGTP